MTRLVPFSFYRHFSSAFTLFTLLKIGGIRPLFVIVHFFFLKKEILAVWVGYSLRHASDCPIPASKHTSKYFFEFQKITHHLLVHAHLVSVQEWHTPAYLLVQNRSTQPLHQQHNEDYKSMMKINLSTNNIHFLMLITSSLSIVTLRITKYLQHYSPRCKQKSAFRQKILLMHNTVQLPLCIQATLVSLDLKSSFTNADTPSFTSVNINNPVIDLGSSNGNITYNIQQ